MKNEELLQIYPELKEILANINLTKKILNENKGPKLIGLISGSKDDQEYFLERFKKTKIFKSSRILSILEKTRKGNFLGTLCFYNELKKLKYEFPEIFEFVVLCGMIFGKGERFSPITHALKNRKPSLPLAATILTNEGTTQETIIEAALKYFSLISNYLELSNFKGIIDKWGDEIQIPGKDLFLEKENFKNTDIIRMISETIVTPELAKNKEWIGYDSNKNFLRQIPRRPIEEFEDLYKKGLVKKNDNGEYVSGVNLGSLGISFDFLEVASEIFFDEIEKPGVYFDFDPYFLSAIALSKELNSRELWENERNESMNRLDQMMIPNIYGKDFFDKIISIKKRYLQKFNRDLNMKILDFGKVFWADIGQHKAMRETYFSLIKETKEGIISREIAGIASNKDKNGNIIINSELGPEMKIKDSLILNSNIFTGDINDSIVIDCNYFKAELDNSLALGDSVFSIKLNKNAGSINTISKDHLEIPESFRHVSIPLEEIYHFIVHEDEDLKNEIKLTSPLHNNKYSFRDLYEIVSKIPLNNFNLVKSKNKLEVQNKILQEKINYLLNNKKQKPSVGVGIMILRNNRVLLGKRHVDENKADSELHGEGTWTMPGGKIEYQESFEEAAKREVLEETGLVLKNIRVFCVNNDKNNHAHFVTLGLFSDDFIGEPKVMEPDEITQWNWFDLKFLPSPLFFPSKKLLDCYKENKFYISN